MNKQSKGYIFGSLSGATWGLNSVLIGIILSMSPFIDNPSLVVGAALICSMFHDTFAAIWMSVMLLPRAKFRNIKNILNSRDALFCILGAILGGPLAMSCYVLSIKTAGPALSTTITASYPLIGSAMAVWIMKERITLKGWIGLLLCLIGVIYIGYTPEEESRSSVYLGIVLSYITAIGWASEGVICAYGMKSGIISPRAALLIREVTSSVTYITLILPAFLGGYDILGEEIKNIASHTEVVLYISFAALIGMFSFLMWYTSISYIGAAKALCLNVTYSFWSIIFSVILLGQKLSFSIILGASLVLAGVILATLLNKNDRK